MPIRTLRPTNNGSRHQALLTTDGLSKVAPEKALLTTLKKNGGRNNQGYITCRHKGGGHKQKYRIIDFKRSEFDGLTATVKTIEYDPNRTCRICLVCYENGQKRYILAPKGLNVGDKIVSGKAVDVQIGNSMELGSIPDGQIVHNVEFTPGKGGQICRSAGTFATVLGHDIKYVTLRLMSGEVRKFLPACRATIGAVGNEDWELVSFGKAGKSRWRGIRPTVRGSAMNPNDHPHGGGEGKCPIGHDAPRTPWGKRCQGVKTRKAKKWSNKLIVRRRNGK